MKESVLQSLTQCKNATESIKSTILAEINENMSNGIFDIPISYQKLITFANSSQKFFEEFLSDDNNFDGDTKSEGDSFSTVREQPVEEAPVVEEPTETLKSILDAATAEAEIEVSAKAEEETAPEEETVEEEPETVEETAEEPAEKEVKPEPPKATVIGQSNVHVKSDIAPFDSQCFEERSYKRDDFVYDQYELSLKHAGAKTRNNAFLYIAPLTLPEQDSSSVPIVVHAYCGGRFVTASSYDKKGTGHSLVTIEINDFYILCRGYFEDGVFKSYFVTTGPSADAGDELAINSKSSGCQNIVNHNSVGHIKFREDKYMFEVLPISPTDNNYIVITIQKEFIDYQVIATEYGSPRLKLEFEDGTEKELIAYYDGDTFIADFA